MFATQVRPEPSLNLKRLETSVGLILYICRLQNMFFLLQDQGCPVTAVTVKLISPSNEPVKEGQLISLEMTKNGVQKSDGVSVGGKTSKVSPCSSCEACIKNKCPECCCYIDKTTCTTVAVVPSATGMYTYSLLITSNI